MELALATPPPSANASAFQLTFANSIWIQQGFPVLPAYLDTLAENYGAGRFSKDFRTAPEPAREAINGWVANHTEGIAVDEKGTTAAAATGVSAGVSPVPTTLDVDRPFLFVIRHNPTGAILFQAGSSTLRVLATGCSGHPITGTLAGHNPGSTTAFPNFLAPPPS